MSTLISPRFAAAVLATAALAACSDGTEPLPNILNGQWGSEQVSLVAINSGAEVQLQCAVIVIEDGIELDANNGFSVRGQARTYQIREAPREVRVTGQASGTSVSLTFPDPVTGETVTHELEAGVLRPMEPFCPQPAAGFSDSGNGRISRWR